MSDGTRAKKGARKKKQQASGIPEAAEVNPFADLPFEDALSRLEGLVDRLEEGDLDLALALSHFEEGVQLTKHCSSQLEAAERRIELLTRESGEWATRPFAGASDVGESRAGKTDEAGEASEEEDDD